MLIVSTVVTAKQGLLSPPDALLPPRDPGRTFAASHSSARIVTSQTFEMCGCDPGDWEK